MIKSKRPEFLQFSPPLIGEEEIAEVVGVLRSDWLTTGPRTKDFETKFAEYVGAPAALAVNSATAAMLAGLAAMSIREGDEVITTPMTFCSTVHVIEHLRAKPVLVDVQEDTLNIDPGLVESAVTKRTKAILPVHLYGHPCDLDALQAIGTKHGLSILEDAAHALPAVFMGRMIGSSENLAAFSFYATKNLTTGEGGMLVGPTEVIEAARVWSLHGMTRDAYKRYAAGGSWQYEVSLPGFKSNMSDIQAAIGLQQLKKLEMFQTRRREIVRQYNNAFRSKEELQIPTERSGVTSALHIYPLRLNLDTLRIDRGQFIEELRSRNIAASVHFIPIHTLQYYREKYGYHPADYPIAYDNYLRLVSLPLNLRMSDRDVADVIDAVIDVLQTWRK